MPSLRKKNDNYLTFANTPKHVSLRTHDEDPSQGLGRDRASEGFSSLISFDVSLLLKHSSLLTTSV